MSIARCPKCDQTIANIHYESHSPSLFSGFRGSSSFTAVAYPCGHAIGAVPITWEMRLNEIDKTNRELKQELDYLHKEISHLIILVKNLNSQK